MSEVEGLSVNYSRDCESNLGMSKEGWLTHQAKNQEAKGRPHAQENLLAATDKCKLLFLNNLHALKQEIKRKN